MNKKREIINTGRNGDEILARCSARYKMLKIEKLGRDALKLVLDLVKKSYTNSEIAKILTETYGKTIKPADVGAVLRDNAELMSNYRAHLETHHLMRANLVLDAAVKFTESVDLLDESINILKDKMGKAISHDDIVKISRAMNDNIRTMNKTIIDFKKITGQYKESPSIVIDQSHKSLSVMTNNDESTNRLAKELGMANFIAKPTGSNNNKTENVIDIEINDDGEDE